MYVQISFYQNTVIFMLKFHFFLYTAVETEQMNKADSNLKEIFSVRGNTMSLQFQSSFELVWSVIVIMRFFAFRFHNWYLIFASCYAAASGE